MRARVIIARFTGWAPERTRNRRAFFMRALAIAGLVTAWYVATVLGLAL